eukprot:symbB.v1.2.038912.t1/scaffold6237.1/size21696/2
MAENYGASKTAKLIELRVFQAQQELTTERWTLIVKYKTAFYSFYLPVALAMLVTGVRDRAAYDTAREALLEMGIYFQAQDDYLDAFASPEVLGKVGTDIQDKKCSWLFAHAYHEQSTPEAKSYLDKHYGTCEARKPGHPSPNGHMLLAPFRRSEVKKRRRSKKSTKSSACRSSLPTTRQKSRRSSRTLRPR